MHLTPSCAILNARAKSAFCYAVRLMVAVIFSNCSEVAAVPAVVLSTAAAIPSICSAGTVAIIKLGSQPAIRRALMSPTVTLKLPETRG